MKSQYQKRIKMKLVKEWKKKRKCGECGNKFIPNYKRQFYCSKICKENADYKIYKKKYIKKTPNIEKICIICNNKFMTCRKCQLVCGIECRRKYYKQKNKTFDLSTGKIGAIGELLVSVDLMKKGFEVYRALSSASSSDLIIKKDNKISTIEVRAGRILSNNEVSYPTNDIRSDVIAVIILQQNIIKYFPDL